MSHDTSSLRSPHLTFSEFRQMAVDPGLSPYEKIGFPTSYRENAEEHIFDDIRSKLPLLEDTSRTILEIGPGCTNLPRFMIDLCRRNGHTLLLVDAPEMLSQLPDEPFITKIPGPFPHTPELLQRYQAQVHIIVAYSVLQHAFADGFMWQFFDSALQLLAPGGEFLLGDIPNISKRKRFFSSENGIKYHQAFTGTQTIPEVTFNCLEPGHLDDGCLFGLLLRARGLGFDAYLVPQDKRLPMENRREDIVIRRP